MKLQHYTSTILIGIIIIIVLLPNTIKAQGGIDTLSTISSFEKMENFYTIDYSGDYSDLLDWMDDLLLSYEANVSHEA